MGRTRPAYEHGPGPQAAEPSRHDRAVRARGALVVAPEPEADPVRPSGMGRFGTVLLVAAAGLLALAACAEPPGTVSTAPKAPGTSPGVPSMVVASFPAARLSLHHPRRWRSYRYLETSSFTYLLTFLSTDRLHAPCTVTRNGSVTRASCGAPLSRLSPGGVLITWMAEAMPGRTLAIVPGRPTRIGGHPARVLAGVATGSCAQLGGAWQEQATIDRAKALPSENLVAMSACIAAPQIAQARQDVKKMLATVRFTRDR